MDAMISDSEWETSSSSDSSSSEDQEEIDFQYGGQAQSILSSLEESIGKIDDFLSFERTFINGDVVCSLSDPTGQMGRVTSCDLFVDLENVKGKILKNVNSKELSKIRSISEGDHVIKGPWLGRVQRVVDKVTVLFDDGSKSDIIASEREKVLPLTRKFPEDSQCPYYPGQRVKVKSTDASKSAGWLCGTWRDNQDEGTVCAVDAGLVYVKWLASVLVGSNLNVNAPPCWQDSKNLTVLSSISSHANWQLGDWCMLSVADKEETITLEHSMTRCKSEGRNLTIGELFIIGKIKAKVDILWQNGEHTLGLDPENLLPVNVINTHEFWPHQFVLEKGASNDPSSQRWGVVQCVDAKEHTVKVQWKTVSVSKPNNLDGDRMEETVSAYELVEHPDYSCFYGDIMFKAAQNQFGYQADKEKEKPVSDSNAEAAIKNWNQMSYHGDFPDDYYLSCVGTVIGFKDGNVEMKLATGFTTKVCHNSPITW
jgi:ubiquitin-conjugating enzyme E2 O